MLLGSVLLKWKMKNLNTNNLKWKLSYHFRMLTKSKEKTFLKIQMKKMMLLIKAVQVFFKKLITFLKKNFLIFLKKLRKSQ